MNQQSTGRQASKDPQAFAQDYAAKVATAVEDLQEERDPDSWKKINGMPGMSITDNSNQYL